MHIFGGTRGQVGNSEHWTLDVSSTGTVAWRAVPRTSTWPAPRLSHTMSIDARSSAILMFGGESSVGMSLRASNVLIYDSAGGWRVRATTGTAAPPLHGHASAYDATSDTAIFFGGYADMSSDEAWRLRGAFVGTGSAVWSKLTAADSPAPRAGHAAAYDAAGDRLFVHGGVREGGGLYDDLWVLQEASGRGRGTRWRLFVTDDDRPPGRQAHTLSYDERGERLILFGGVVGSRGGSNDLWVLDASQLANGAKWRQVQATGEPPKPRAWHSSVYDAERDVLIVFGGRASDLDEDHWNDVVILNAASGRAD